MAQPYSPYISKISQIFLGKIPPSPSPSLHLQFHTPTQYRRNLSVRGTLPGGISLCSYAATGTTVPLHLTSCAGEGRVSQGNHLLLPRDGLLFIFFIIIISPALAHAVLPICRSIVNSLKGF